MSRTTLFQIEKGKDAQLSKVEAVARVLGAYIAVQSESPQLTLRRQARADAQVRQAASREKHLRLAVQFALGGAPAQRLKDDALRMVALWSERSLCSPVYVHRWQAILQADPQSIAQALLAMDDEWGAALRQNTPFALDPV